MIYLKQVILYLKEVKTIYLYLIIGLLTILTGIFITLFITKKENITEVAPLIENKVEEIIKEELKTVKVDIKGSVQIPGVYELDENKRVIDVINLAGGLLENADTSLINLSKKLTDQMTIIIYTKDEIAAYKDSKKQIEYIYIEIEKCPDNINDACINDNKSEKIDEVNDPKNDENELEKNEENSNKISINKASVEELDKLPGIGESKAKSIVQYREEFGLFTKIEDIKNVDGIGDSLFEKIKDYITI